MTHIQEQYLVTIEANGDLTVLETHTSIHPEMRVEQDVWTGSNENWFIEVRKRLQAWIALKEKEAGSL